MLYIPCKFTIKTQKNLLPFISLSFCTKRAWKCDHLKKLLQNTVCLERQIYANQESFTQPLVVMVETFRRSEWRFKVAKNRPQSPIPTAYCKNCIFLENEYFYINTSIRNRWKQPRAFKYVNLFCQWWFFILRHFFLRCFLLCWAKELFQLVISYFLFYWVLPSFNWNALALSFWKFFQKGLAWSSSIRMWWPGGKIVVGTNKGLSLRQMLLYSNTALIAEAAGVMLSCTM